MREIPILRSPPPAPPDSRDDPSVSIGAGLEGWPFVIFAVVVTAVTAGSFALFVLAVYGVI